MKNKSIITIRGYSYGGQINELYSPGSNIKIETANTHSQAIKMLVLGRAEYLIDYKEPVKKRKYIRTK